MTPEQLADATEGCVIERDCSVRQVQRGYVINGTIRYLDPVTRGARLAHQHETVASDSAQAATAVSDFLTNGSFD
jgi:hypothetical protein